MTSNIEDRIAVQDVMLRYAATVDEKDYAGYRALFAEDVVVVGMGPEEMKGMDTFYPWWKDAIDQYDATQHMLSPTYATISGDEAKTRTDVQATHYPKGDSVTTITLWATYHTDMRRVDGEWKICRHELVFTGTSKNCLKGRLLFLAPDLLVGRPGAFPSRVIQTQSATHLPFFISTQGAKRCNGEISPAAKRYFSVKNSARGVMVSS